MLALLSAIRVATANDRTCYAGIETDDGVEGQRTQNALVVVREIERDAGEIRVHYWTDADSERAHSVVYKVDAKAGTFEFPTRKARGTGTLVGAPWRWTAYHAQAAGQDMTMAIDGELHGASLIETMRLQIRGWPGPQTTRWDATVFDCGELDKRRSALSPASSATAVRACFAGTVRGYDGQTRPAILVQTIDRTRIELRQRNARARHDDVKVVTIDGDKVRVNGQAKPTAAKLIGKPGAWTSYSLTDRGPNGALTFTDEGTLGGAHAVRKLTIAGAAVTSIITTDAMQFDCKELESHRAAMTAAP